jgi:1,4-alpha-glucan branching enzyme
VRKGELALVLHAHLPFVRHPEHEQFLEEDWLFEAITETYLPLIRMMRRLAEEGVPFRLTMSLTPTLCAMLDDALLRERYVRYLERSIDLAERELDRTRHEPQLHLLAQFYHDRFENARQFFATLKADLLSAFRQLRDAGGLELLASAATHGVLPLLPSATHIRAQVLIGRDEHLRHFGAVSRGMWLPECAYSPAMTAVLQEANVRWFILDAHGLLYAHPLPRQALFAPCYTPAGPAAFARDGETSRQIWSAQEGYPGDPAYRDFYRDIGFDLPLEQGRKQARRFTGIKYHRVTGQNQEKQLYEPEIARRTAEAHARDFVEARQRQFRELGSSNVNPIIVAPFDAELFGHWWFEGPQFLEAVIRQTAVQAEFGLTSLTDYLAAHPTQQICEPAASSWGANGYFEVWLNEKNHWIQPLLHAAGEEMCAMARRFATSALPHIDRTLQQLARELLLAQASDWPFLIHTGTASAYATARVHAHLARFARLREQLGRKDADEEFLAECEWRDNIFPQVNWRYFAQ